MFFIKRYLSLYMQWVVLPGEVLLAYVWFIAECCDQQKTALAFALVQMNGMPRPGLFLRGMPQPDLFLNVMNQQS